MSNVTKLPTAATSYYTVSKHAEGWWAVVLVTPSYPKPLRTKLVALDDLEATLAEGRRIADTMKRPFREPRGKA